jgi:uncharacterized protein (DUF1684 family)
MSDQVAQSVTRRFVNRGLDQVTDIADMLDGQLVSMLNVTSDQEGSISSKAGYKYLGQATGYTLPHTLVKWATGAGASDPRYFGEGQYILRTTDWNAYTEVLDGISTDFDKRMAAVAYSAGGTPSTMYFATPSKMRKDTSASSTPPLAVWGLFAPTRPPTVAVQDHDSVDIDITSPTPAASSAVNSTSSYTTVYDSAGITKVLSQFTTAIPSGSPETFYDSDDYIQIDIAITNLTSLKRLAEIRLELDCADTSSGTVSGWVHYYSKSIMPSTMSNYTQQIDTAEQAAQQQSQLQDQNVYDPYKDRPYDDYAQTYNYPAPTYLPPYNGSSSDTIRIRKSEFLKVGQAGTTSYNWSSIKDVRVLAIAASLDGGVGPTVAVQNIKMVGGSGPDSSGQGVRGYRYVFTYRDPITRHESNPCVFMVDERTAYPTRQPVLVTATGTAQSAASGAGSIAIYRAGGSFQDDYYRFVGYAVNPGAGLTVGFYDRNADEDIRSARTVMYDNDPPVPSTLRTPFVGVVDGASIDTPGTLPGQGEQTWTFSSDSLSVNFDTVITAGSRAYIQNGANSEEVLIESVGTASLTFYCQRPHSTSASVPLTVSVEVAAGKPCFLAAQVGDSIFLAGDDVNPDTLYASARGRPESFPFATGDNNVRQLKVGSAANPIMNITEFNGVLVSLNKSSIFVVKVWQNVLQAPEETPAQRGLFGRQAWCKAGGELWYVAHDGVYSWSGGISTLRSHKIRWMFQGRTINGITPIDMTEGEYMVLKCARNKVFFVYKDTGGFTRRLIYDLSHDRWELDDIDTLCMSVEDDSGDFICSRYNAAGAIVISDEKYGTGGTSRGFTAADGLDGQGIAWNFKTGFFNLGSPDVRKLFTSIAVELTKGSSLAEIVVKVYYDYSGSALDVFTFGPNVNEIPISATRQVVTLPLQVASSSSRGREAKCFALEFIGDDITRVPSQIHSVSCSFIPLDREQRGDIFDWQDAGHPWDKRLKNIIVDYDATGVTGGVTMLVDVLSGIEGNTYTEAIHEFVLESRGQVSIPAPDNVFGKKFRLRAEQTAFDDTFLVYKTHFVCENLPPDIVNFTEWSDLGHEGEKRLSQLFIAVDTAEENVEVEIQADGATVQTITVNGNESNRNNEIPVNIDVTGKNIRLKVTDIPDGGKFQLFSHRFEFEKYPPLVVYSTPYSDFGSPFSKFVQEILFDVNTNNKVVPVKVYGDGVLLQTIDVQSTMAARKQRITLDSQLTGKQFRLEVDSATIPTDGRFQLWDWRPIFENADKGPISHSFDWSDLGWPHDKEMERVSFEYETSSDTVTLLVDTISGLNGNTTNSAVQTFTVSSSGRGLATIALNNFVCKMIRLRSTGTDGAGSHPTDFKMWNVRWEKENRPADVTNETKEEDLGWKCDKIFRGVGLTIDTGGVACTVSLVIDGTVRDSWSVTTTDSDRMRFLSPNVESEMAGKMYQLRFAAGTGGKSQLYKHDWTTIRDACGYRFLDTHEQAFGSAGYTYLKQIWLDYRCSGQVLFRIYNAEGSLFWEETCPAHTTRSVHRFYLPAVYNSVLNKSTKHSFEIEAVDSNSLVKLYRDSCRVEYLHLSNDARQGYNQAIIWEGISIAV